MTFTTSLLLVSSQLKRTIEVKKISKLSPNDALAVIYQMFQNSLELSDERIACLPTIYPPVNYVACFKLV